MKAISLLRAPYRYDGSQVDTMDGMTGHIPGAVNHFYESGYTVDGPKSVKDLEAEYYNEIYQNRPVKSLFKSTA